MKSPEYLDWDRCHVQQSNSESVSSPKQPSSQGEDGAVAPCWGCRVAYDLGRFDRGDRPRLPIPACPARFATTTRPHFAAGAGFTLSQPTAAPTRLTPRIEWPYAGRPPLSASCFALRRDRLVGLRPGGFVGGGIERLSR